LSVAAPTPTVAHDSEIVRVGLDLSQIHGSNCPFVERHVVTSLGTLVHDAQDFVFHRLFLSLRLPPLNLTLGSLPSKIEIARSGALARPNDFLAGISLSLANHPGRYALWGSQQFDVARIHCLAKRVFRKRPK